MSMPSLRNRSLPVALFLLLASLILLRIPLFNSLGYEFSASIALALALPVGFSSMTTLRRRFPSRVKIQTVAYRTAVSQIFRDQLRVMLLPVLLASANSLWVRNCAYGEGLLFYILVPVVTCVFCVSLATWCFAIFRHPRWAFIFVLGIILLHPLYTGYFSPQIYSYNFIYGYFPGFSYDETLTISATLLVFRTVTMMAAVALLLLASHVIRHGTPRAGLLRNFIPVIREGGTSLQRMLLGVLLACVAVSWALRYKLHFETSVDDIREELSDVYVTEHFHIFYRHDSFTSDEIGRVATEHEFRFHQVAAALAEREPTTIDSYIYPDQDAKRRFIGTGTTNIAKPWRREIHLDKDSWEGTVKHEIVHVLAARFGLPIIKAHYNTGIVEGLATAIDNDAGSHTLHEYAASILRLHIVDNPKALISAAGFMTQSSGVSYTLMGSYVKFLIDRFGIERFKLLYGGKSAVLSYGRTDAALVEMWKKYLERIPIDSAWLPHVRYYYQRPSIFAKECARAVAELNEQGFHELASHRPEVSEKLFATSLGKSWNTPAFSGLVRSMFASGLYDSVASLMDGQSGDSERSIDFSNLLLLYGDALWQRGQRDEASREYSRALDLDLSLWFDEAAALRLESVADPALRETCRKYFLGSISDSSASAFFDMQRKSALASYLRGRINFRRKEYAQTVHQFERTASALRHRVLNFSRAQMLAESYFHLREFQKAKAQYWQSLNILSSPALQVRVDDWVERCDWYQDHLLR